MSPAAITKVDAPSAIASPGNPHSCTEAEPQRDAEQEADDAERDERSPFLGDEDERERDGERDPREHPQREVHDEMPELATDVPP